MKLSATPSSKNALILKLSTLGISLLVVSALVIVMDPVQMVVDSQLSLRAGSLLYNMWLKPPLDVYIMVYMFNVTNLEAFTRGIDPKLKLKEVGPYVYQEILENHNVTFNANNTVTYTPRRTVRFVPERSVGDPKVDKIIAPNIPYMGVTSASSSFSAFAAIAVNALTKRLNVHPMLKLTVHDYLWGYEDQLVQLASKFIPSVINFQRFGLLERMFDEGHNVVTMKLPEAKGKRSSPSLSEDSIKDYAIDNWNGKKGIKFWDYKESENNTLCNTVRGTHDATLFPRKIDKGETFRIYRKAFCRTLPIVYSHPSVYNGIEGYNFKLQENAFDSDLSDPESSCFCKGNKCLKRGLGNITPCYYNIPLAISFPHFFNADPSLLEPLEGLQPNEAKHGTEIVIQPQLGIPMKVHSRFQINLLMSDTKYNRDMVRFRNKALPIFWLEIEVDNLTPGLVMLLKLLFKVCPYLQVAVVIGFTVVGVSLVCGALLLCFWVPTPWDPLNVTLTIEKTPLHSNYESSKMANVGIFPLLKKHNELKLLSAKEHRRKIEIDPVILPLASRGNVV